MTKSIAIAEKSVKLFMRHYTSTAGKQYISKVGLGDSRRSENDSTPGQERQPPD
jgi:hypothetical protein